MKYIGKFVVAILFSASSAFAAAETAVLELENLTCSLCSITVKKALQRVPGVEDAKIDYDARTATVKYDPAKTSVPALVKATTDAGFPSTARK